MAETLAELNQQIQTANLRDLMEAWRYQERYSGIQHSQMSCVLPVLDRLTKQVAALSDRCDQLEQRLAINALAGL
jgi:hypothetical protein